MSTQLRDVGDYVEVSTVTGIGGRKKLPRGAVLVLKSDRKAVRAEVARQAAEARKEIGIQETS